MNGSMRLPAAMALKRVSRIAKFLDHVKDPFVELNLPLTVLFAVYRPIAWLRVQRGWITFMPELWFVDFLKNLKKKKLTPKA